MVMVAVDTVPLPVLVTVKVPVLWFGGVAEPSIVRGEPVIENLLLPLLTESLMVPLIVAALPY